MTDEFDSTARKLVLLLDGTMKGYETRATNIFHLYSMLSPSSTQLTYYQPGIGSLEFATVFSKLPDAAFALTLKKHLKAAYTFVVRNCKQSTGRMIIILFQHVSLQMTGQERIRYICSAIRGVPISHMLSRWWYRRFANNLLSNYATEEKVLGWLSSEGQHRASRKSLRALHSNGRGGWVLFHKL